MKQVNCEDFERELADFITGGLSPERKDAFEKHRQHCVTCRNFSREADSIREALRQLPQLQVPPYFMANLKREINRLERGLRKPQWNMRPAPRLLSLSAGFALAIFCGVLFLHSGNQPSGVPTLIKPPENAERTASMEKNTPAPSQEQGPAISDADEFLYAEEGIERDTSRHRLPEPAGQDSIPIPIDNDYWKLNQVSTTQNHP